MTPPHSQSSAFPATVLALQGRAVLVFVPLSWLCRTVWSWSCATVLAFRGRASSSYPSTSCSPGTISPVSCLLLCALLSGCTVGPNYQSPDQPAPATWNERGPGASSGTLASPLVDGPADISRWWRTLNDPTLADLITRAYAQNLDLAQAQARVRQARASRIIAAAGGQPSLDLSARANRQRFNSRSGGITSNNFQVGADASWEIDVFGGIERGIEAADADVRGSISDLHAVLVSLSGEVGTTYADLRGSQSQLDITNRNLALQLDTLALTRERAEAGFVSQLDVANAEAQVASTQSQIPTIQASINSSIYALSVLVGAEPADLYSQLVSAAPLPSVPSQVAVGIPSEVLKRRPDVQRAEESLHAATARIGVAVADRYPKFTIGASAGLSSDRFESLGNLANRFWSLSPGISWSLLDGDRVQGNIDLAKARLEEADAAYRQSILIALQDVETAMANFTRQQQRRELLAQAVEANRRALDLALERYQVGKTDFLSVLTAQGQLLSSEQSLSQANTSVLSNLITLYKAMGGGWGSGWGTSN
jgi:multidrug efflux system outer membrane protein